MATKGAITLTIVFEGMNLNRDEGVGGNIQTLKKLHRGDGYVHTFMSRQALRYAITKKLIEEFGWKETPVTRRGERQKTNQFDMSEASIIEYEELDLFGYMYTIKGENAFVRTSVCKLTPAISLEKFSFDQSFNANHEMVKRAVKYGEEGIPNPWQTEDHFSFYKYSFVIDLDKLGKIDDKEKKVIFSEKGAKEEAKKFLEGYRKYLKEDDKEKLLKLMEGEYEIILDGKSIGKIVLKTTAKSGEEEEEKEEEKEKKSKKKKTKKDSYEIEVMINLPVEKKVRRIVDFLKAIKTLSRGIQGNINSLFPLLVIGGVVKSKTPLAHPLVELAPNSARRLNKSMINYAEKLLEGESKLEEPEEESHKKNKSGSEEKGIKGVIVKGIVKEKFENGYEFKDWKTPDEAIDNLISFIKNDEFKKWLENEGSKG